jgi:hypothetical protein
MPILRKSQNDFHRILEIAPNTRDFHISTAACFRSERGRTAHGGHNSVTHVIGPFRYRSFRLRTVKVPLEPTDALAFASCADNNHVGRRMADLHERITDSYEHASVPVILTQIQLAGERLAAVLMAAFPGPR